MFLWNFCHLFPELFYQWNTSINDSFRFFGFFLGIISWKVALLFNGEGFGFQLRGVSFLSVRGGGREGAPLGNTGFDGGTSCSPHYGKPWYTSTTGFKNINTDIMECLVVMECIYNVNARKSPTLLSYIATTLFEQQWVLEKVEESSVTDIETDNDSEELPPEMNTRWKEIGHLDFVLPTKKLIKKWLLNFSLFAIKIWQNHTYHDRFSDGNVMFSKDSISLYNEYVSFLKLHSSEESNLLIKDSFKGFVSNRYRCLGELSSMFLNRNLTIDLFFVNQVDIHVRKFVVAVHAYYNIAWFSLYCEVASMFHEKITIHIKKYLGTDEYKDICFRLIMKWCKTGIKHHYSKSQMHNRWN